MITNVNEKVNGTTTAVPEKQTKEVAKRNGIYTVLNFYGYDRFLKTDEDGVVTKDSIKLIFLIDNKMNTNGVPASVDILDIWTTTDNKPELLDVARELITNKHPMDKVLVKLIESDSTTTNYKGEKQNVVKKQIIAIANDEQYQDFLKRTF